MHLADSNKYLILKQQKYGQNEFGYCSVGGVMRAHEEADECARRHLLEQFNLVTDDLVCRSI